jgi:hypothetical protein
MNLTSRTTPGPNAGNRPNTLLIDRISTLTVTIPRQRGVWIRGGWWSSDSEPPVIRHSGLYFQMLRNALWLASPAILLDLPHHKMLGL